MNLTAIEAKPFVPASDLERAKEFYSAVGFEIPWSSADLAYVRHGQTAFLLQNFYQPEFIRNFQMHLLVESVDDWHAHLKAIDIEERFGVRMGFAGRPDVGDARLHAVRSEWRAMAYRPEPAAVRRIASRAALKRGL